MHSRREQIWLPGLQRAPKGAGTPAAPVLRGLGLAVCVGTAAAFAHVPAAQAATFVWDGGSATTNNWSDAANWVGDIAPTDGGNSSTVDFLTGTAPRLTANNPVNDFNFRHITFDASATSYTVSASQRTLFSSNSTIFQHSGSAQLFAFSAATTALGADGGNVSITGIGTGLLTFGNAVGNGVIGSRDTSARTLLVNNGTFDVVVNSTLQNNGGGTGSLVLSKSNLGSLTLRGTNTYTGGTSVNGGPLVLDYDTLATGNRLPDTSAVGFSGGDLRLLGDSAGAAAETVGAVNVNAQGGTLTLLPGSGQSATFTGATLNRGANTGSILFRGTNLGATSGTYSQAVFMTAPTLTGGAGAAGTPQVSIIPYALGDTSAAGTGAGLVTYDATVGVRLLDENTEFAPYATAAANENAKITAGGAVAGSAAINSLLLRNATAAPMTVTLSDTTNLAPVSGTFLFAGAADAPVTLTKDTAGAGDATINLAANTSANFFVTADTTATVNAPVRLDTTGALVKHGAGTLVLNQNVTRIGFAGTDAAVIAVNGGTLKAGAANSVVGLGASSGTGNPFPVALQLAGGTTLDFNGFDQQMSLRSLFSAASGSTITNRSGTNAVFSLAPGASQIAYKLGSGNVGSTIAGLFTDGNGAGSGGRISLVQHTRNNDNSFALTYTLSASGHQLHDLTLRSEQNRGFMILNSSSATADNDFIGTVLIETNGGSEARLTANAMANGADITKLLGDVPIQLNANGRLFVNTSSVGGALSGNTFVWGNDVTATVATGTSAIEVGNGDGLSTNNTLQLGALTLAGSARQLAVNAKNGYALEFAEAATLSHTAATTSTLNVLGGTLALSDVGQFGTGDKGLTKTGTGTLLLKGAASYAGLTTVSGGTLVVGVGGAGSITGAGGVVVGAGTLGGSGSIAGAVAVNTGGTLAPGNSVGTLTTGGETWNGGGAYVWEINDGAGTAGGGAGLVGWDLVDVNGAIDVAATSGSKFTIKITSLSGTTAGLAASFADGFYAIATFDDPLVGFDPEDFTLDTTAFLNDPTAGEEGRFTIGVSGSSIGVTYAVPEPGAFASLVIAGVGLAARRERRARRA